MSGADGLDEEDDAVASTEGTKESLFYMVFSGLVLLVLVLLKELRKRPRLSSVVSDAALILLVGTTISFLVQKLVLVTDEVQAGEDDDNGAEQAQKVVAQWLLSFEPQVFARRLLPPILFNSGYQLCRELFYRHIILILFFAVVGTVISVLSTAFMLFGAMQLGWFGEFSPSIAELLTFGVLISATDTVSVKSVFQSKRIDPRIFYVVFGETAMNDAVAMVLFKTIMGYRNVVASDVKGKVGSFVLVFLRGLFLEAVCAPVLAIVSTIVAGLALRWLGLHEYKMLELAFFLVMIYFKYMLSEYLGFSGIVTIFFSGMSARRYIDPNLSEETSKNADAFFKITAFLAETCIFLELGLSLFGLEGTFNWPFIGSALVAALIGRALTIYPIAVLYNFSLGKPVDPAPDDNSTGNESGDTSVSSSSWSHWTQRKTPLKKKDLEIPCKMMHILWFAGVRGAVAYACVREFASGNEERDEFIAATTVIILVTVVFFGGMAEHVLRFLDIEMNVDEKTYMKEWHKRRKLKGCFHRFEHNFLYRLVVPREDRPNHDETDETISTFHQDPPSDPIVGMPVSWELAGRKPALRDVSNSTWRSDSITCKREPVEMNDLREPLTENEDSRVWNWSRSATRRTSPLEIT